MTVKGTKKKSYDLPIKIIEIINLAILNESTRKVIFNEKDMLLKMLKESATFRKYEKQAR